MTDDATDRGSIRYELTWNEYWRAHEVCWRAATGRLFLRLVPATGLIAILTGFVLVFTEYRPEIAPIFWLFGAVFLSARLFRRFAARREYRRLRGGTTVTIEWDSEGISSTVGSETRRVPWEDVRVLLTTSEGFLVEGGGGPGMWMPFSGFGMREEIDQFEAAIRSREVRMSDRSSVG